MWANTTMVSGKRRLQFCAFIPTSRLSSGGSQLGKESRNRLARSTVQQQRYYVLGCIRRQKSCSHIVKLADRDVPIETALRKRMTRRIEALRNQSFTTVEFHFEA